MSALEKVQHNSAVWGIIITVKVILKQMNLKSVVWAEIITFVSLNREEQA